MEADSKTFMKLFTSKNEASSSPYVTPDPTKVINGMSSITMNFTVYAINLILLK